MITLLIAWAVLAIAGYAAGSVLLGDSPSPQYPLDRMVIVTWTGLLWIALLLLALSIALPLGVAGPVLLVGGAITAVVVMWRSKSAAQPPRQELTAALLITAALAFAMCGRVELYDSGLYHRQNIAMLRDYGTLTGASLIYFRLGFSSSWFALSAALEPAMLVGRMSAVANGLLLVIATVHFASALWRITRGSTDRSCWYLAFAYPVTLYYLLLETAVVSPSPNPAVALSMVLLGWVLISAPQDATRLTFLLAAGTACLKLTAMPAAVVTLLVRGRSTKRDWLWVAAGVAPLLAANFITSGYPAFPGGPRVQTAHTMPAVNAAQIQEETIFWGRYAGKVPPNATVADVAWLGQWMREANKPLLAVLLIACGLVLARRYRSPAVVLGFTGCAFLFATAPDFRFLAGYIGVLAGAAAFASAPQEPMPAFRWLSPLAWAASAVLCWTLYATARESLARSSSHIDWAARLAVPVTSQSVKPGPPRPVGSVSILKPAVSDQCWDLNFPCTPDPERKGTRLCDPAKGLAGGFCLDAN